MGRKIEKDVEFIKAQLLNQKPSNNVNVEFAEILSFQYLNDGTRNEPQKRFAIPSMDVLRDFIDIKVDGISYLRGIHYTIIDSTNIEFGEEIAPASEVWGEVIRKLVANNGGGGHGNYHPHNQTEPSDVWHIYHGFGYYPAVTLIDDEGYEFDAGIRHIDTKTLEVILSGEYTGKAILR